MYKYVFIYDYTANNSHFIRIYLYISISIKFHYKSLFRLLYNINRFFFFKRKRITLLIRNKGCYCFRQISALDRKKFKILNFWYSVLGSTPILIVLVIPYMVIPDTICTIKLSYFILNKILVLLSSTPKTSFSFISNSCI